MIGDQHPRISTPGGGPSWGPQAVALAQSVTLNGRPLHLDQWQQRVLNRGLRHDNLGGFKHEVVGLLVARGNGKSTGILVPRALWGLVVKRERVLIIAQNLNVSEQTFAQVVDALESLDLQSGREPAGLGSWWSRNVKRLDRGKGSRTLELNSGATLMVRSHRRAVRGLRAHTILWDECREFAGSAGREAYAALSGSMSGLGLGRTTQMWLTSNAGDSSSEMLNDVRDRGRAAAVAGDPDSPICWMEWSAPAGVALDDPAGWAAANPSLGIRVRADQLEQRAKSDPGPIFKTEHLCQWVETMTTAVERAEWEACTALSEIDPGWPCTLGVEVAFDRRHVAIVGAWSDPEGVAHVRLLHAARSDEADVDLALLASRIREMWEQLRSPAIYLDPRSAGPLVDHLKARFTYTNPVQLLGAGRLAGATSELLARTASGRIRHDGDPVLTEQILAAGVVPSSDGGVVLSRRASSGPIPAAIAAALALHGAGQAAPNPPLLLV